MIHHSFGSGQQVGVPLQKSPGSLAAQVQTTRPLRRHWQAVAVQTAAQTLPLSSQKSFSHWPFGPLPPTPQNVSVAGSGGLKHEAPPTPPP
ncbi:MAG: hypothetical protein QM820_29420 [Minicystis sp.]